VAVGKRDSGVTVAACCRDQKPRNVVGVWELVNLIPEAREREVRQGGGGSGGMGFFSRESIWM